jgi:hypothetical protein
MKSSFSTRINRLAVRIPGDPVAVLADEPFSEEEIAARMRNWRQEVASGRASRWGPAIVFLRPAMSSEEWEAAYSQEATR